MNAGVHRKGEKVGQRANGVEAEGDDGEEDVGAQDAQRRDAAQVAEKLLLLDRQAGVKDDGRQEVPAHRQVVAS